MTNEERELIARFVARVGGAGSGGGFGASVPATQVALPPIDPEADQFIAQQMQVHPEARYRVTQMAVVQEAALAEAQNRIKRLEWELSQARAAAAQAPRGGGGLFGGLFGGNRGAGARPTMPPQSNPYGAQPGYAPPPPQYPPNYQPGMFGRGGSGFLGSALTTAAGVAGGLVVGNALMDMFDGRGGGEALGGGGLAGGDPFAGAGVGGGDPWGASDPGAGADPWGGDPNAGGADPWGGDQGGGDPFGGGGGGGWDDDNGGGLF